jgi:hypothetical protein
VTDTERLDWLEARVRQNRHSHLSEELIEKYGGLRAWMDECKAHESGESCNEERNT